MSFVGEPARGPVEQISIARSLNSRRIPQSAKHGGVAELADALDLGSSSFIGVQVRFLSPPLNENGLVAFCHESFFVRHPVNTL